MASGGMFMRTIVSVDSPWLRFSRGRNPNAERGAPRLTVFSDKANALTATTGCC
jgi:hypothetical protein